MTILVLPKRIGTVTKIRRHYFGAALGEPIGLDIDLDAVTNLANLGGHISRPVSRPVGWNPDSANYLQLSSDAKGNGGQLSDR